MLKRTDELNEMIKEVEEYLKEFKWPISNFKKSAKKYINQIDNYCAKNNINPHSLFEKLEKHLHEKCSILSDHKKNYDRLIK